MTKHQHVLSYGFTLIELLVVIAIVAILARVSLPAFLSYLDSSAFGACQQELVVFKNQVFTADSSGDALQPYNFGACQVGSSGQPSQSAVVSALHGNFADGSTKLVLETQRDGVQAQIMANGSIERVVTP